jgi:hypothetical protein
MNHLNKRKADFTSEKTTRSVIMKKMKKATKLLFGGAVFFMVFSFASCSRSSTGTAQPSSAATAIVDEKTTPEYGGVFTIA